MDTKGRYGTISLLLLSFVTILTLSGLVTACSTKDKSGETDEQKTATSNEETTVADSLMAQAMAVPDAPRMLALADSLEATGDFSPTAANYYRGGAYTVLQKVVLPTRFCERLRSTLIQRRKTAKCI